jgi:hypothetical protein
MGDVGWGSVEADRGKEKHTNHDQPLRLLNTVGIGLRIPQCLDLDALGFLDLCGGSVADEDRLASPFDDDLFSNTSACYSLGVD